MNIALLCVLIVVMGETDSFHGQNARTPHKEELGQRILLRKLQTFQRDDPTQMKTATWNQILADALLNRIKIFSFNKETESKTNDNEIKSNFLTNCVSQMMHLYKVLIYDKFVRRIDNTHEKDDAHSKLGEENKKEQSDYAHKGVITDYKGPKDDVEILEPRYHGKLCDNCDENSEEYAKSGGSETVEITDTVGKSVTGCPDGLVASDGSCSVPKSKFILSIPYQCPTGYRRDWFGYCRPML